MPPDAPSPCPFCGSLRGVVHVHGHGQCVTCNTNIQPCCTGDSASDAGSRSCRLSDPAAATVPRLFPSLFETLGGRDVTVTTDCLLFALSTRLGSDYEEARLVVEAAERVGILRRAGPGLHRLQDVGASVVDPPGKSL